MKGGIGRIKGMERIKECIEKNNLTCLSVPQKYLYHVKGRGRELTSSNYFVVAEKQFGKKPRKLFFEEVRQICIVLRETGYYDFASANTIRLKNNKLVIIDTENHLDFDSSRNYLGFCRILHRFSKFNIDTAFSKESLIYIFTQLLKCIPKDKEAYSKVYNDVYRYLQKKQNVAWDYKTYFEETFPKPE